MRELYTQALERRILLAPCNDAREIVEHAQLRDRELFVRLDYPHLGASIEHPDFFAKVRNGRIALRRRAPRIGEHDAEVRAELARPAAASAPPPARSAAAARHLRGPARARDRLGRGGSGRDQLLRRARRAGDPHRVARAARLPAHV